MDDQLNCTVRSLIQKYTCNAVQEAKVIDSISMEESYLSLPSHCYLCKIHSWKTERYVDKIMFLLTVSLSLSPV